MKLKLDLYDWLMIIGYNKMSCDASLSIGLYFLGRYECSVRF